MTNDNPKEHLKELLSSFDTAMFITRCGEREHARPMMVAKVESSTSGDPAEPSIGTTIWFVTSQETPKSGEIKRDARVSATFQSARRFVALSGTAELIDDHAKVLELWKPVDSPWFPNGKDDPNLVLVKITVTDAEFWDLSGTKGVRHVYDTAKTLLKRLPRELAASQHGRVKEGSAMNVPPPAPPH